MKPIVYTNTLLTIGVILLGLMALKNFTDPTTIVKAQATARRQMKFEVADRGKDGRFSKAEIQNTLNNAAADGWQLVAVFGSNQDITSKVSYPGTGRNDVVFLEGGGTIFIGFLFQK